MGLFTLFPRGFCFAHNIKREMCVVLRFPAGY